MELKAGQRITLSETEAEFIVVMPGTSEVSLTARGDCTGDEDAKGAVQIGKRYFDAASNVELLCVKPGAGPIRVDGRPFALKEAKPLPASD